MNIEINDVDYCKINVKCVAEPSDIQKKLDEVLNVFKDAPVSGFRKGKASLNAIRMRYRKEIDRSVSSALQEEAFHQILFEKNIQVFGTPKVSDVVFNGNEFKCTMDLNHKPEIKLEQYKDFAFPAFQLRDFETVKAEVIKDIRTKSGYKEMAEVLDAGDTATVSYTSTCYEEKVEMFSHDAQQLVVGKVHFPGFNDAMLGMKVGETKEFTVIVPEQVPTYGGQEMVVTLTVTSNLRDVLADLNDALAEHLNKKNLEELMLAIDTVANNQITDDFLNHAKRELSKKLVETYNVQVPLFMLEPEIERMMHLNKIEWNKLDEKNKSHYANMSASNVLLGLILETVRETDPETQLTQNETNEMIQTYFRQNNYTQEMADQLAKSGYMEVLISRMLDEHTLTTLVKACKFE